VPSELFPPASASANAFSLLFLLSSAYYNFSSCAFTSAAPALAALSACNYAISSGVNPSVSLSSSLASFINASADFN